MWETCVPLVSIAPSCVHMKYNRLNSDAPHVFHRLRTLIRNSNCLWWNTVHKLLTDLSFSPQDVCWKVGRMWCSTPTTMTLNTSLILEWYVLSALGLFSSLLPIHTNSEWSDTKLSRTCFSSAASRSFPSVLLISHFNFDFTNTGLKLGVEHSFFVVAFLPPGLCGPQH